ncbi:mucoidy inhibitor MuiA family protein [Ruegeria marisrubri]|uniref:DUF4139 domain-containing protein n=1 Tax=Ruegeria marisrubri TaxID=1685379 RepID=UPI001CD19FB2|nr:DUF4139 domain-containing protein [Ruegeria marisrubri]MCA0908193.1 mucoidy inhibitor MuiA family protein [Ruegeria marisrubri]
MRPLIFLLAFAPCALNAETFLIDTKVSEVTVYPNGADIIRTGTYDIPAGNHRLVLQGIPANDESQLFSIQVLTGGLTQTAMLRRYENLPIQDHKSDAVIQAEDRIKTIEDQITDVADKAMTARLRAEAARQSVSFLGQLGQNEGLPADPETLREITRMIAEETLRANQDAQSSEIEARRIEQQLEQLGEDLQIAQADLAALIPETDDHVYVAVDVTADAAAEGILTVSYIDAYTAEWFPGYEFHLTTGDAPSVRIDRNILITQDTGENWRDVTMHVSTIAPTGQNAASWLPTRRHWIRETPPPQLEQRSFGSLEEPVVEAPVVMEETSGGLMLTSSVDGTGVTYTLPNLVSVSTGHEITEIALDTISQSAEVFALGVPWRDDTAYRTARFTNPIDQKLLSSSTARWFVDDVLVAAGESQEIGPREEVEMGFGPIHGLTLARQILNRSSGDAGIISRSNQRIEQAEIRIENLTDQSWPLRLLDRVPFSEQDDLGITWSAEPRPSEVNVDNKRGILAWEMDIAPEQSETITLDLVLNWPEGMELR